MREDPLIDRRTFLAGTGAVLLAAPLAAEAQQAGRVYRVGLVSLGGDPQWWRPVLEAMRELDYVEGRNLIVRRAFAKGHAEDLPRLVAELLRSGVDVVVTTATRETRAVKQAAPNISIVMLLVPDPVTEGFVTTLARPGGNVTGMTIFVPSFVQKYVELLREAVPSASRFVVLGNPGGPTPEIRAELERAARTFGIMLSIIPVSGPDEIDAALARAKREGAAGIIDPPNYVTFIYRRRLAQTALKYGMPGIYWAREYAQDGGLLTYSPDMTELRRRAATFVDKILKGAKPAELPVEQPRKFELVINLRPPRPLASPSRRPSLPAPIK